MFGVDPKRWAGRRVAIAVPDATRSVDPRTTLAPLLAALGPHAARIDVVVALGLHRPMTTDELAPLSEVCGAVPIVQHDPAITTLLHPRIEAADAVICIGIVEPHQYAGFSGGVKTVAIGCASAETIAESHSLELLRDPKTRIGSIEGNPFQAKLWSRVDGLREVWALQVVPNVEAPIFGPARKTFDRAVELATNHCFERHDRRYAWMHLAVPSAKAQSFYQASRVATYVALVPHPVIAPGGVLIVDAKCPEGLGRGAGERAFAEALAGGRERLAEELRTGVAIAGGAQRAYVLIQALERARIALVGAPPMPSLDGIGIGQYADISVARRALDLVDDEGVRVEDVFSSLPIFAPSQ